MIRPPRLRWRTIRQRPQRANRAQVSAIATILGLLLVVSMIANFVILQLPQEETNLEFQHLLQVENQVERLQATVLAEASHGGFPLSLPSPVTLGSAADPPFGPAAPGAVFLEPTSVQTRTGYTLAKIVPAPPNWGVGSGCLIGGGGHCSSNGNVFTYNESGNNTTIDIKVTGNSNSLVYNITGSNDTISIDWTGGSIGFVTFQLNGSDDIVNYNKGGSSVNKPNATFYFFGQRDTFNFSPSGGGSGKQGVFVTFVGSLNDICPNSNLSSTDKIGTLGNFGNGLNATFTWWNSVGYSTPFHQVAYPGGSLPTTALAFQNISGGISCAFTKAYTTTYSASFVSGLVVRLANRYLAVTDIAYDQGAVIEQQTGARAIMVSPPAFSSSQGVNGISATLTLINAIGNYTQVAGTTTASVSSQVLATDTFTVGLAGNQSVLRSSYNFTISTAYPAAWVAFFATLPSIFPFGASCSPIGSIPAPYSCLQPPPGKIENVRAPLTAFQLTVTTITLRLAIQ